MNTVRDFILIKNKMHKYHWVKPDETVATALKKMSDHNLGAILVLEKSQVTAYFPSEITRENFSCREGPL